MFDHLLMVPLGNYMDREKSFNLTSLNGKGFTIQQNLFRINNFNIFFPDYIL
jgi:hypothetical protein